MKLRKIVVERKYFLEVFKKFQNPPDVEVYYHVKHMPKDPPPWVTTDPVNYFL